MNINEGRARIRKRSTIILLLHMLVTTSALAYEPSTHQEMSSEAANRSRLGDRETLGKLGFPKLPINQQTVTFPNSEGALLTPRTLIRFGADYEDTRGALQATRHFYNPVDGSKLLPVVGDTSPDWALEDRGLKDGQAYSYRMMRRYFLKALTDQRKEDRDYHWGLTFQTLGHVMHHLQDMAQPQHVRGDAHCDAPFPCTFPGLFLGYYSPSIFEKRVEQNPPSFGSYPPVYVSGQPSAFATPRQFWHTNSPGGQETGKGIAEFTNRSFVSAGTNFDNPGKFALPALHESLKTEVSVSALCESSPGACGTTTLTGTVTFYGNEITDHLTGERVTNPRMTTKSIFDSALSRHVGKRVFSYNKFNADSAAALLVPRAVGYSAGLINYFFRSDFELIRDPLAGWYRIKNNSTESISGRFRVFFDDAAGNRQPIAGAEWTLYIPPGGLSERISFAPPANSRVAGRESLLLVFDGTQGQESPTGGEVGAVGAHVFAHCLVPGSPVIDVEGQFRNPVGGAVYEAGGGFGIGHSDLVGNGYNLVVAGRNFRLPFAEGVHYILIGLPRFDNVPDFVHWADPNRGGPLGPDNDVSFHFFGLPSYVWNHAELVFTMPDGSKTPDAPVYIERRC